MTPDEYSQFKHDAVHELTKLNEQCTQVFRLGEWERYDYDLERQTLTFSQGGTPRVVASIQVVGTTSETARNWLWGWPTLTFLTRRHNRWTVFVPSVTRRISRN